MSRPLPSHHENNETFGVAPVQLSESQPSDQHETTALGGPPKHSRELSGLIGGQETEPADRIQFFDCQALPVPAGTQALPRPAGRERPTCANEGKPKPQ